MSELIARESQRLEQDARVEMFELDARRFGDGILRFTPGPLEGEPVRFNGYEYHPMPIQADGFKWDGHGTMPRPTLRLSVLDPVMIALIRSSDDLVGTPFKRLQTFRRFLDDGTDPDPEAMLPPEHFVIERKTNQNSVFVEFELSVEVDQQGRKIPARQIIRDTCTHTYRRWNGNGFSYENVTCPYTRDTYYDAAGAQVWQPELDMCGKRLSDCRLRFGNGTLPTRAFPGAGRIR